MIIAIPVLDDNGKESRISAHFGHNPLFAICDTTKDEVKIVNIGEHGQGCTPVEGLKKYSLDAVFTIGIGGMAMNMLKEIGMPIKTGKFATVGEVMKNADSLDELEEGCGH